MSFYTFSLGIKSTPMFLITKHISLNQIPFLSFILTCSLDLSTWVSHKLQILKMQDWILHLLSPHSTSNWPFPLSLSSQRMASSSFPGLNPGHYHNWLFFLFYPYIHIITKNYDFYPVHIFWCHLLPFNPSTTNKSQWSIEGPLMEANYLLCLQTSILYVSVQ